MVFSLVACGSVEESSKTSKTDDQKKEEAIEEKVSESQDEGEEKANEESNESEDDIPKGDYKIGYTCPTLNNPFFVSMKEGAELAAEERGASLTMFGGDNDVTKQIEQIEDFISQDMDAIIVQTVDTTGIITAIEAANEAGIPVFTTAERPAGGEIESTIVFDSYESGYNGGTYIGEKLEGVGEVVELVGVLGQETSREKSRGFQEALDNFEDIVILASQPAEYDRATAMSVMENMLQAYDNIDAVYAANDEMALGAVQAIEAAGKLDEIFVMGNDGTDEALQSIEEGKLGATNGTPGYIQGYIAVDVAIRFLNGENVPSVINERNTIIDADNLSDSERILKGVSREDWYWLDQFDE